MTLPNQRKSFIIHKDSLDILDQLNDEQAGKLFKAIFHYQKTGDFDKLDQFTKIILTPFISQFKRDEDKWLNVVERNKANIAKRWNKEDTTGKTGIPNDTKNTDSDSKSDSDNKNKKKYPDFIKDDLFDGFIEMRKKIKKPLTEKAQELIIKKLSDLEAKQSGFANKALENSIENSWQGVFEPKNDKQQPTLNTSIWSKY